MNPAALAVPAMKSSTQLWHIQDEAVKLEVQKGRLFLPFAFKSCLWLVFELVEKVRACLAGTLSLLCSLVKLYQQTTVLGENTCGW